MRTGRISLSTWSRFALVYPVIILSLPLSLGNAIMHPLAAIMLLPYIFVVRQKLIMPLSFLLYVLLISLVRGVEKDEWSIFQAFRSAIPFFYCVALFAGRQEIARFFMSIPKLSMRRAVIFTVYCFSVAQFVQVVAFYAGINLANSSLVSEDTEGGRVFVFGFASTLIIFFYACISGKSLLIFMTLVTLLATGSKSVLLTIVSLYILYTISRLRYIALIRSATVAILFSTIAIIVNPRAIERLGDFFIYEQKEDVVRGEEIAYARAAFFRDTGTVAFGNGVAIPITPGVQTLDPRWAENSKYDIENGYWSLLAKIGVIGFSAFCYILLKTYRSIVFIALIVIEILLSFGSSVLFFAGFEGPLLIVWCFFIDYLVSLQKQVHYL